MWFLFQGINSLTKMNNCKYCKTETYGKCADCSKAVCAWCFNELGMGNRIFDHHKMLIKEICRHCWLNKVY